MSTIPTKNELRGAHSQAHRILDERVLRGIGLMRAGRGVLIEWDGTEYVISSISNPGGGSGGLQFQQPYIELDPTIGVPRWTIVNVSPTNPMTSLVTALFDLVSGNQTVAPTGYWVACDDIPAQVVNPSGKPAGTYYNVPVMPPSVAWVSSPGSQKGDLDQAGILWLPLPRTGACV